MYFTQDNDWKKDSVGCWHLRTLELADSLVSVNNLLAKSTDEFINVFGIPNKKKEYNNKIVFIYYLYSVCKEEKLVENADKCWVEFIFKDNKLTKIPTDYFIE
jgi:hypothetical protein